MTSDDNEKGTAKRVGAGAVSPAEHDEQVLAAQYGCTPEQLADIRRRLKENPQTDEEFAQLCAALETVPELLAEAYLVHVVFGLPYEQIAGGLGVSADRVKGYVTECTRRVEDHKKKESKD